MITDRIGLHSVLLPLLIKPNNAETDATTPEPNVRVKKLSAIAYKIYARKRVTIASGVEAENLTSLIHYSLGVSSNYSFLLVFHYS